ncbi:MAG: TrkH family potassium uptake protein [Parabacteroides sp.]|nr:TrkH family potassium uptake protein [Parabacteroides sp.]
MATAVSYCYNGDDFPAFVQTTCLMLGVGFLFNLIGYKANDYATGRREGMLIVAFIWIFLSLFGMLPYYLSGYIDNVTDAFFETMSGFTTTGTTILRDIEALPHGLLFWRSLTQWQGGLGIIVFTVAILPRIGGGVLQMFNAEIPGITHERFLPRVTQVAKRLFGVYLFLTFLLTGLLWIGPMDLFDSINHALTCMSTGGYSTKNASIAHWNSPYIEYVITLFMFIAAINFTLIYFSMNGKPKKLWKDEETRWYFWVVLLATVATMVWILSKGYSSGFEVAFRQSIFQVVTLITTCGYATVDYIAWGPFFWLVALFLMLVCGCAGSTCGGLKMGRFVILAKNLLNEFKKQTHPNAILPVRMNDHAVSRDVVHRVLAFTFVYGGLIFFCCIILTLDGLGFEETIGAAVTAIGNVGPALGSLGPAGNYADVPVLSKWVISFLMLVGRLEIFTIVTILLPGFWKQ